MSIKVQIPAFDDHTSISNEILIEGTVSADHNKLQRITITDGEEFNVVWKGKNKNCVGQDVQYRRNYPISYTVNIEYSINGGKIWKASSMKDAMNTQEGNKIRQTIFSEDGGDQDYDDAVVTFSYTI